MMTASIAGDWASMPAHEAFDALVAACEAVIVD